MQQNLRLMLCLMLGIVFNLSTSTAQLVNFEETWKEFLANNKVSNISELPKPSKENYIDYAKYSLMYANNFFCGNKIDKAEDMMKEVNTVGEERYKVITGFSERYTDLRSKMDAYHKAHKLWLNFLKYREVSMEKLQEAEDAARLCEKGTLAKYSYMLAYAHYCNGDVDKAKKRFENYALKIIDRTSLNIKDVPGLEGEVAVMRKLFKDLAVLEPAWQKFVTTSETDGFAGELPIIDCYVIPSMKAYMLQAAADVCKNGAEMLAKIQDLQAKNSHPIGDDLQQKIAWLEKEVQKNAGDLDNLNKAWTAFVPTDTLMETYDFGYDYCDKANNIRAYLITGMLNTCTKGQEMLDNIDNIQKEHQPQLNDEIASKLTKLKAKVKKYQDDQPALERIWTVFIENKDTLNEQPQLAKFYCDKIAQVKSWVIKGHFEYCSRGQAYLDIIDDFQKEHQLKFDKELACRVLRLRGKVWDCRYWEIVQQARKETHAERERFGPEAAKIMHGDLNSEQQPCETTVQYSPLDYIGVKYAINTYLCQDIDLAKMGDPEYYKKIAAWVDTEVLQKYCEESMRCKEDFFIYLEGHTDGHAFRGARYKESLEIPEGTRFTHFDEGVAIDTATTREITNSLKNNMELGIARAWTVKNQLDFMGVPIHIGAYEHSETEKGGEFRKILIELNIPNLLLDFYEKTLAQLLEESGIGERPGECEES